MPDKPITASKLKKIVKWLQKHSLKPAKDGMIDIAGPMGFIAKQGRISWNSSQIGPIKALHAKIHGDTRRISIKLNRTQRALAEHMECQV